MLNEVASLADDPAGLEALYRELDSDSARAAFAAAIASRLEAHPDDLLMQAWSARLAAAGSPASSSDTSSRADRQHWTLALALAAACGVTFMILGQGGVPAPAPGEAERSFWLGWAPAAAIFLLGFVGLRGPHTRLIWAGSAAAATLVAALLSAAVTATGELTIDVLTTLHMPFLAWAMVGFAVTYRQDDFWRSLYAFAMRSIEVVVAAGMLFGMGMIFAGLTGGVFEVLRVNMPDPIIVRLLTFGLGCIPVLAVASVYDPSRAPLAQRAAGVSRLVRIATWLLSPFAVLVLALYVGWFVPTRFWEPFGERTFLIVYNATIMAILALLAAVVSGTARLPEPWSRWPSRIVLTLGSLTLLLNAYALAAVAYRVVEFGLTPNRHAVLGWNIATLVILGMLIVTALRASPEQRVTAVRRVLGQGIAVAAAWTAWVLWILPLL